MSRQVYTNGVLREQWDDTTRLYTAFDGTGAAVAGTPQAPNPRPYTPAENASADAEAASLAIVSNGDALRTKAAAALDANATFLAIGSPTNAQVVAHVQRLTRETSALIRLVIGQLDSTTGT